MIPVIYAWFYTRKHIKMQLIFRGTRDGFTSSAFHEKLDGHGPLIFFVKSAEFNKVFGGFTALPWTKPENQPSQFIYDYKAWIFSLTHRSRHLPIVGSEVNAV